MPWWAAAIGAVGSYVAADQANSANAKAAKNSGQVNLTQTNLPWGPDAQYRMWMMDAGADVLGMPRNQTTGGYANPYAPRGGSTTGSSWPGVTPPTVPVSNSNKPPPSGPPGPGGAGPQGGSSTTYGGTMPSGLSAKQQKQWTADQARKASGGKGGKGGGTSNKPGGTSPAPGVNTTTQQVMDAMYRDIAAPNRTEDAAVNYANKLLTGGDTNAYRTEAADMLRGSQQNDNLDRLIADLFAGNTPGTAKKGGGGAGGGGGNVTYGQAGSKKAARDEWQATVNGTPGGGSGGGGGGFGQVGVVDDIKKILAGDITRAKDETGARAELKKVYEGQGIPQEYRDMLARQYEEAAQKNAREMNSLFVGANMQGSSSWQEAFARGQSDASQGYSDALIGANFGLYNNALQMGQGYDLADQQYMGQALGIGAQYDTAAQDRAAQERIANANANAAGAGQAAAIDAQLQMARMGALGDAIGMQMQGRQFGAQGMAGLSGLYSGDTQQALGMTGELSNLNTAAWGSLGNIGVGRDQVAASIKNANTAANTQRGIANSQLDWQKSMWNDPMTRLGKYADLVNASSASYGSQLTTGVDQRNAAAPGYVSPWGQAISGGLAGYGMASGR